MYSYQWRDYDPAIGRFNRLDRFSEKYYRSTSYGFTSNNPIYFREFKGDSIKVNQIIKYDESKKTNYFKNIIVDLNSQTGLSFSINYNGQLIYATDSNGNQIQAGSSEARKIMISAVLNKNQSWVRIIENGRTGVETVGASIINLVPNQINDQINGAIGVNNKTLGWGMTLMHEILHSNVAEGGAHGHGEEAEIFGPTGIVVDRMNLVRSELNTQGLNYGQRMSYSASSLNENKSPPLYIPFDKASKNKIENGVVPNTMFIQIR